MKKTCFAVLFLLIFNLCPAQDTTKILFIGNSLTYFNQMPQTLQKMFEASGKPVKVYQKTAPGMNLKMWLDIIKSDGDQVEGFQLNSYTFRQEKFNFIIIQEATIRLLIPHLREEFFDIIGAFTAFAHESGGTLLFYEPYPTYEYPKTHCLPDNRSKEFSYTCSDKLVDSEQESGFYARLCTEIIQEDSVQIAPVGKVFEEFRKAYPTYTLLADEQHPNALGSYLIAYTIYRSIVETGQCPVSRYLNEFNFIQDIDKAVLKEGFTVVDKVILKGRY